MKNFLALAASLLIGFWCLGQQYGFIQFNIEEGLPHSQVRSLMQDDRGFLWVGTLGGVSRFDGEKFVNYSTVDGLNFNQINTLYQLKNGQVAAGTKGGYGTLFNHKFTMHMLPEKWHDKQVNVMCQPSANELWLGTENGILKQSSSGGKIEYKAFLEGENIKSILAQEGQLLAISKIGVFHLLGSEFQPYLDNPNDFYSVMDACFDGDSLLLATSGDGVVTGKLGGAMAGGLEEGLPTNRVNGIVKDGDQGFWLRTSGGFAYLDRRNKIKSYGKAQGLPTEDVRALLKDGSGTLWLGTNGGGLFKFTGEKFVTYTEQSGLSSSIVMTATNDQEGNLWVGSFDNGITKLAREGGQATHYAYPEHLPNNKIWTSLKAKSGSLWFGTSDGLVQFSDGDFKTFEKGQGLPHNKVLSLVQSADGVLWVGTNKGLARMNKEGDSLHVVAGIPKIKVRSLVSLNQTLYVGTVDGLYTINQNQSPVKSELPIQSQVINSMAIDSQNRLWIGTTEGLAYMDSESAKAIFVDNNPRAQIINFVLADEKSQLWVGTNNGIYNLSLDSWDKNGPPQWNHLTRHDGISSLETNLNAAFEDQDGYLWFGTAEGLVKHTPSSDKQTFLSIPQVALHEIKLNLEQTDWSSYDSILDPLTGLPRRVVVTHDKNHFTFAFSSKGLADPKQISYQYKLDGCDDDWQPITSTGNAVYSNLPYSSFVFEVRAKQGAGPWGESTKFPLEVRPPYWRTWWFVSLMSLIALLAVVKIFQTRRNNLLTKMENEKLHYKSRMMQLEQQTLNSSMNRHFIFNSLNSIQYYINRQDRRSANTYLSHFAKLIRKNLDSSQHNFTTLSDELERLRLYLKLEHMRFQDKFSYNIEVEVGLATEEIKIPSMLLQPFLENSIWHGILPKQECGNVLVKIESIEGERLMISVKDDGIGVNTSLAKKADDPSGHISQGMQITNNRIILMQKLASDELMLIGPTEVCNPDGSVAGTVVELIIPLNLEEKQAEVLA